mmetsp:Transcript_16542/g.56266  ORF Transcript_16542/g.56266 Transcript_16542/m.56266 type:complete len:341 (+) Transcript_16542:3-1025(+)
MRGLGHSLHDAQHQDQASHVQHQQGAVEEHVLQRMLVPSVRKEDEEAYVHARGPSDHVVLLQHHRRHERQHDDGRRLGAEVHRDALLQVLGVGGVPQAVYGHQRPRRGPQQRPHEDERLGLAEAVVGGPAETCAALTRHVLHRDDARDVEGEHRRQQRSEAVQQQREHGQVLALGVLLPDLAAEVHEEQHGGGQVDEGEDRSHRLGRGPLLVGEQWELLAALHRATRPWEESQGSTSVDGDHEAPRALHGVLGEVGRLAAAGALRLGEPAAAAAGQALPEGRRLVVAEEEAALVQRGRAHAGAGEHGRGGRVRRVLQEADGAPHGSLAVLREPLGEALEG